MFGRRTQAETPATFEEIETELNHADDAVQPVSQAPSSSYLPVQTDSHRDETISLDPKTMATMADDIATQVAEKIRLDAENLKAFKFHYEGDGPHEYEIVEPDEEGEEKKSICVLDFKTAEPMQAASRTPSKKVSLAGKTFSLKDLICYGSLCLTLLIVGIILIAVFAGPGPRERRYFIAIDEVDWDYAPSGRDQCHDKPFDYAGNKFLSSKNFTRVGRTYTKAVYVEYTDHTFTVKKPIASTWEHLGIVGPPIRAEVGDRLKITVKNNARFAFSMHAHGGFGDKDNEGASYQDGSLDIFKKDDALSAFNLGQRTCQRSDWVTRRRLMSDVHGAQEHQRSSYGWDMMHPLIRDEDFCMAYEVNHGEERTYTWDVEDRHGPGPKDPSSIVWIYQSHVGGQSLFHHSGGQGVGDTNAGLVGPIIITGKGQATGADDLTPQDVDREFVLLNNVFDENDSPYMEANIFKHITQPKMRGTDVKIPIGWVPFGVLDKARVLQALYQFAVRSTDKLSYAAATAAVDTSMNTHQVVDKINGQGIKVWFDKDSFNPEKYDAIVGQTGKAEELVEGLFAELVDRHDPHFTESNMMHAQNGFVMCNQPNMVMKQGERVRWYTLAVGNGWDLHTPHWHGNTLLLAGHRVDEYEMVPGSTKTVDMHALNPGKWLVHCHVNDHIMAGMSSFYQVDPSDALSDAAGERTAASLGLTNTVRQYYVQAEESEWDYYPGKGNVANSDGTGTTITDGCKVAGTALSWYQEQSIRSDGNERIGTKYKKVRYIEYTDATFTTTKVITDSWKHLGILGPVLRAEVGDTIKVLFKNGATKPYSMHPHGVHYTKGHEGAPYADAQASVPSSLDKTDDIVTPGTTHEYVWNVPEESGPGPDDSNSMLWMYHSHVSDVNNTNAGLVGPIIITAKGQAKDSANGDLTPKGVDREFVVLPMVFDEGKSDYALDNIANYLPNFDGNKMSTSVDGRAALTYRLQKDAHFKTSNKMRSLNGRSWCSLDGLDFDPDQSVRWYMMSLGDENPHSPMWQGHTLDYQGHRVDTLELMPASMKTADMTSSTQGSWLLYSNSYADQNHGMQAKFTVGTDLPGLIGGFDGVEHGRAGVTTYFIAADEVEWDYMPEGKNLCPDQHVDDGGESDGEHDGFVPEVELYTKQGVHRVGSKYIKAQYREYGDATFKKLLAGQMSRNNDQSHHLGSQGPVLRANEGDVVEVVFKNYLRFPCNFYVHGLQPVAGFAHGYKAVAPGESVTYRWKASAQSAPLGRDGDTIAFSYESTAAVDGQSTGAGFADVNAGLYGTALVSKAGSSPFGGRELIAIMSVTDENKSPYIDLNLQKYATNGYSANKVDPVFKESNRMHHINGFMFCNLPGLNAPQSRSARLFLLGMGPEKSIFAPRLSGTAFDWQGQHVGTSEFLSGTSKVVEFTHSQWGWWLFQDQVRDHARAGMAALFHCTATIAQ